MAEEQPAEEQPAEEQPAEEAPAEEAPAEEAPAEEEAPKEEEAAAEEPKEEEAPKDEPTDEPKPEEEKEKPKEEKPKKAPKQVEKVEANDESAATMWKQLSKKSGTLNWYILKLKNKVGKGEEMICVAKGTGGVNEMVEFFQDKEKKIFFALLKVITTDNAMSVRSKFVYMKFLGSKVKTMTKAKLTGSLGKIDDQFPCKHLSLDINENCADDLKPEKLAKELLRVGGAHKPDKMSFGPDQDVDVTNM